MIHENLRRRLEQAPYNRSLGLRVEALGLDRVRLRIPYSDEIANPGGALHGGVIASLIDTGGALSAWSGTDVKGDIDSSTLDFSVNFLAAALNEDIFANAEVLRRGKELTYSSIDVRNAADKRIAAGLVTYRLFDRALVPPYAERQRHDVAPDPPATLQTVRGANMFVGLGFIAKLGITVSHAFDGSALLHLPLGADVLDANGAIHEGAIASLIDTTGALSSWSVVGLNMSYKASTVGIHVNYHAPADGEAVDAYAMTQRRNNEIFLNHVTVSGQDSKRVIATGSVTYRIVVND